LLETFRGIQQASDRGMEVMAGGGRAKGENKKRENFAASAPLFAGGGFKQGGAPRRTGTKNEERRNKEKNMKHEKLKLIRYKILFVKRDYEHAFDEVEVLVADNIDGAAFTAWKIAEFIQTLGSVDKDGRTVSTIAVPSKWNGYPEGYIRLDSEGK